MSRTTKVGVPLVTIIGLAITIGFIVFISRGCTVAGNMHYQPRYLPLEYSSDLPKNMSAQPFQPHTVVYDEEGQSPNSPVLTGLDANGKPYSGFPFQVVTSTVQLGQERFDIYCVPCHGPEGRGNGKVIPFGFSTPADLLGDKVKALPNGQIFDVITNGFGLMYSYGYRVKPQERWAVIAYIRAMELKNGAVNPKDLTPADLNQINQSGK